MGKPKGGHLSNFHALFRQLRGGQNLKKKKKREKWDLFTPGWGKGEWLCFVHNWWASCNGDSGRSGRTLKKSGSW